MERKTHCKAGTQAAGEIRESLSRNHTIQLPDASPDRPHRSVLIHSGRYTHPNTVDDIKYCDQGNDRQKSVNKQCKGIIHGAHLPVALP